MPISSDISSGKRQSVGLSAVARKPSKGKKSLVARNSDVTRINSDVGGRHLVERREARISIGPLPPPDELKKYEEALRGTGKAIVDEFKKNGQHRRIHQRISIAVASFSFVLVAIVIGLFFDGSYAPFAMAISFGLFLNFLYKN